ncbi:MAG: hypothetical protein GQ564_13270 [Bacteroidales bacterium]|nr:hypothetical protein [Bacteroidales bacterium]
MDHLIAKTKGRKGDLFKVISNKQIFELPTDLDNPKVYDSNYSLEDDEWFAIDDFTQKDYCIELLTKTFASTDYDQLKVDDYLNLQYLCSFQAGIYFFQKLSSTQLIQKKWLNFSNAPVLEEKAPIIVINEFADAIYNKAEDRLYFKKIASISSIFKGIEILYREATKKETGDFLKNDFIKLNGKYGVENVKKANRKRIAMAMDTLKTYSTKDKKNIFSYIKDYCGDLEFDSKESNFSIQSEDDLKKLLFGIEQRYYTTILGGEKRIANSITKI